MADLPVGIAVKRVREHRGMRKCDLSIASGLTRQYIWKVESGFVQPHIETLDSLAIGLNIELWKLLRFAQKLRKEMEL
jgi:transcriptional regulator with XRE-family HTH domain